ncbi:MAG: thymidylate synthase [Prosthecobacter sp.]|nr:thymidylate synthase [Prosthecobacter sp.]
MKAYLDLLRHVMEKGKDREDRTGVGTRSVFGYQLRHDMDEGFPLLTTKKVHIKSILHELLWFLRGETNVRSLQAAGVTIWDEWADANGELGPVYGKQWRSWPNGAFNAPIDQIENLVRDLRSNPNSRRHIVSAWNPQDVPLMKLPPCHTLWQCQVDEGALNLHLYARSIDSFLGLPFNIASYGFLLHMLGWVTDLVPGDLIISFGDLHIYKNHFDQVIEQLGREPRPLPKLEIGRDVFNISDFRFDDFTLFGYDPHPTIKAPIAV